MQVIHARIIVRRNKSRRTSLPGGYGVVPIRTGIPEAVLSGGAGASSSSARQSASAASTRRHMLFAPAAGVVLLGVWS